MTEKWNHWWHRQVPPHAIAILRILFGLWMLLYFGLRLPHADLLFSTNGLVIPYDYTIHFGNLPGITLLQSLLNPPSPTIAFILLSLHVASLITFTLGLRTTVSAVIAFLFFLYEFNLSYHHMGTSYNRLFLFSSLIFIFAESGKTLSIDMRMKHGSFFAWEPVSIFFQRIIAIQITATYLGVGLQKIWLPDWENGSMLYLSFQNMWATLIAFAFLSLSPPMWLFDAMVFIVKAFEVALPFGLWYRKTRLWFMSGGIIFHIGISLFLAAIWWFYAMIACYITFFDPEEVFHFLGKRGIKIPSASATR